MQKTKCHDRERGHPASLRIIAFECWPASIGILRPQEEIYRFVASSHLAVVQRHQCKASCFNAC